MVKPKNYYIGRQHLRESYYMVEKNPFTREGAIIEAQHKSSSCNEDCFVFECIGIGKSLKQAEWVPVK